MMMELCVELITMARVTAGRSSQEMGEHATPCTLLDSPPAHLTSKERPSEVLSLRLCAPGGDFTE